MDPFDPFHPFDHSVYVWVRIVVGAAVLCGGALLLILFRGGTRGRAPGLRQLERNAGIAVPQDETLDWIAQELRAGRRLDGVALVAAGALIVVQSAAWRLPFSWWLGLTIGELLVSSVIVLVVGVSRLAPGGSDLRRRLADYQPGWTLPALALVIVADGVLIALMAGEPLGHRVRYADAHIWWLDGAYAVASAAALLGLLVTVPILRRGAASASEHHAVWRDMLLAARLSRLQWLAALSGIFGIFRLFSDLALRSPDLDAGLMIGEAVLLALAVCAVAFAIYASTRSDKRSPAARRVMRRHWPTIDAVARHPLGVDGLALRPASAHMPGPPPGETLLGPPKG